MHRTISISDEDEARFLAKIIMRPECWEWKAAKIKGYGVAKVGGKRVLAHRVSFTLFKGEITKGMLVLHNCDNPSCTNPEHLRLGTRAENMAEMSAKGRAAHGTDNASHKLTPKSVLGIRKKYAAGKVSMRKLGREHGVSGHSIKAIVTRETWRHL